MKYKFILFLCIALLSVESIYAQKKSNVDTSEATISKVKALAYLDSMHILTQSSFWINVTPDAFLENVRNNVLFPLQLGAGRGTNFCAYAAVTYTCLKNEPLRYVKCIIDLYKNGQAKYRNVNLHPSDAILKGAGLISLSGDLDRNVADQIWFLSLAHKFKGYLNTFNLKYHSGDENTMWAACNLAKFNRMLQKLCKYKVSSKGSDLIRPKIEDVVFFLNEKLKKGEVYLYLNNTILRKKNHNKFKKMIPTHFVVLNYIAYTEDGEKVTIKYWDGGYKTMKEVATSTLQKILYGISWTKYAAKNEDNE